MNRRFFGDRPAQQSVRGRYHVIPEHPQLLAPDNLMALTASAPPAENPESAGFQAPSAAAGGSPETEESAPANSGLIEMKVAHE
jgi:hypothetical protein